jgi:uncharacterized protein YihD (DUF1040 family)
MNKPIDNQLNQIIEQAAKESGWPKERIESLTSQMILYINTGAKYGTQSPSGFFRWLSEQEGTSQ